MKNMFNNLKLIFIFFILKNRKYSIFIKHFLVISIIFIYFLKIVLKINYINMWND